MNFDLRRIAVAAAAVVLLAATSDQGVRAPIPESTRSREDIGALESAANLIIRWPEKSRALAGMLLEKYGVPDEMVASQLSWNRRRPWKKIVVFRDSEEFGRSDHLLETVAYGKVPIDRWRELSALGRGASYDPLTQELSARTDREESNILALNLADEVIRGRRSASDARDVYDSTINLALYGKSSPYTSRLLFHPRGSIAPQYPGIKGEDGL